MPKGASYFVIRNELEKNDWLSRDLYLVSGVVIQKSDFVSGWKLPPLAKEIYGMRIVILSKLSKLGICAGPGSW